MLRILENIGMVSKSAGRSGKLKMQNSKLKMGVLGTAKMSGLRTIDYQLTTGVCVNLSL
jgi:hypothetical protein